MPQNTARVPVKNVNETTKAIIMTFLMMINISLYLEMLTHPYTCTREQ